MSKKDALTIAKEVGITLKNLKTFDGHDGALGINADICLNGFPFAHAYDDAHGGMMDIHPIGGLDKVGDSYEVSPLLKRTRQMILDVEDAISKYPEHEIEMGGGKYSVKEDLEGLVNALVDDAENQKFIKKNEKKGILVKKKNNTSVISFKAGSIASLLKKHGQQAVAMMIQGHVNKLIKDGEEIINVDYLKSIGVKFDIMKTALLTFNNESKIINITDAIFNLFQDREEMCSKSIESFQSRLNSVPGNAPLYMYPEVFQEHEDDFDDDELDEIIDGYFYQKGKELFGFDIERVFVEYYIPKDNKDANIKMIFEPFD